MFYEFHPSSWTSAFPTTKPLTFIIYFSTLLYSISPVPTGAGDVLGQVTVEALESLHCGGGEDQDRCHKSQHFHQQSLLGFLSQLHDLMFCSVKSSQTSCFHVVYPTTEVLAIHVFLRTQNCGACSVLSVTDGVQPPTDWGSLWQEQAPPPPPLLPPIAVKAIMPSLCLKQALDYKLAMLWAVIIGYIRIDINQTAEILTKLT